MLPFCIDLPNSLRPGEVIKIMGSADQRTEGNSDFPWLKVVFSPRCWSFASPFYLDMRFRDRKLTRCSIQYGNWEYVEDDGQFPFSLGAPFVFLIEVQPYGYKFTGNGKQLWTFRNRMPDTPVSVLQVTGGFTNIRRVELIDKANENHPGRSKIVYPLPVTSKPILHPSFPFWGYFPDGLQAGKAIKIAGIFSSSAEGRTTINLCADCFKGPIMMHLDLRFRYGVDINRAVRNVYKDGRWLPYEDRGGPFPFRPRDPSTMIIKIQPDSYNISVNGVPCWTFMHRLPFSQVTSMTIERGPMEIWTVQYIDEERKASETSAEDAPVAADITALNNAQICSTSGYSILFISLAWFLQLI